ncbi:MAG TPA: MBL fold metallo-hydrolase [Bacteroidota bacterium]|nr:MBL fold metallo-hydrolase [Bacteroidota bacterium]
MNSPIRHFIAVSILLLLPALLTAQEGDRTSIPPHHIEGGFRNTDPDFHDTAPTKTFLWSLSRFGGFLSKARGEVPHVYNDGSLLRQNKPYTITWIGQSTCLIQLEGLNILTDPVWSDRVGPVSWAGDPRSGEPGIALDKLPPIDIVLISHNHYDHLDESTITELAKNPKTRFFVPLRLRDWFEDRGISNVEEMDWWEGVTYLGLKIICTPAQHFSGRWVTDGNSTLWCSWVVLGKGRRLYFGGDSGYFHGFGEIGKRLGPFDLALLPIGAYEPRDVLKPYHMNPADAVQAFLDVRAKKMLAIHWGTFQRGEPLDEPPKKLWEEVESRKLDKDQFLVFMIGETREW